MYGRREKQKMLKCEDCGEKMAPMTIAPKEFEKIPKEEIPETTLDEIEIATDRLEYR